MLRTALLGSVLALCLAPGAALAGKAADTLVYASDSDLENVSPYHNNMREGVILMHHVWDGLVLRDVKTGKYVPLLAKSWTWIDPTTLELALRTDVKFHNGDPLTADDVVFTVNYVLTPEAKVVAKQNVMWMAGAEKVDAHTVRIKLKEPFPAAMEYLAAAVPIYPKAYFEKVEIEGFAKAPVGTGPYKIVSATSGQGVKMVRNPDYMKDGPKGQPKIGKLDFRVIPDGESRVAELMTGGVDWIWRVPSDQADSLRSVPEISVLSSETMRVAFLIFEMQSDDPAMKPFKDERVRKAVSMAIDRQAMVDNLVRGGSRVMNAACFVEQTACVQDTVVKYAYDPAKAKALLKEAGYPDGFDTEMYAYRERDYAEAMIGYLQAVGIKAKLNFLKYPAMRGELHAGKSPITMNTWGSYSVNDASAFTGNYFKGSGDDRSRDPEVAAWLKEADSIVDESKRLELYGKALKRISEKAYVLPLFSYSANYAFTKDLAFTAQPDELPRFYAASWK